MKAWLLESQGGLGALRVGEVAEPAVGAGEVLLRVELAALNPADRYLAEGQYPGKLVFPHILGRDAVGVVEAVGSGVQGVRVGEVKAVLRGEAGVSRWGTFAEKVVVPAGVLVDVEPGWTKEQAAGAPLVYLTAYQAITQWADLPREGVVLVTGASGGVGLAAVQLAAAMGYTVVGLSRDEGKWGVVKENGAKAVYSPAGAWRKQLGADFGGGGGGGKVVVLAVDNVGGAGFGEVVESLAMHGRVSVVGRLAGPVPEFNTASLFFRRLRVGGVAVGTYTQEEARANWREIVRLLAVTGKRPVVDRVMAFGELIEAFERLRQGPVGKVLIRVGK